MFHITRQRFCNEDLGWQQISRWCDTWLGWRTIALGPRAALGLFHIEIEIQCVPTADLTNEVKKWTDRLPNGLFEPAEIVGRDTIRLVSRNQVVREENKLDDIGEQVLNFDAQGRPIKIEFVAHVPSNNPQIKSSSDHLVLYGLANGGIFELKAVWQKKLPYDDDSIFKLAALPWEPLLIKAFHERDQIERQVLEATGIPTINCRAPAFAQQLALVFPRIAEGIPVEVTGTTVRANVSARQMSLAASYGPIGDLLRGCFSAEAARVGNFVVKVGYGREETLRAFLLRCGVPLLVVLCAAANFHFQVIDSAAGIIPFWGGLAVSTWMAGRKGNLVFRRWRLMRNAFRTLYEQPLRVTVIQELEPDMANNAAVRKFAEDMKALGAEHFLNLRFEIAAVKRSVSRCYYIPHARTYFNAVVHFEGHSHLHFPAIVTYVVRTIYSDDSGVTTTNSLVGATKNSNPNILSKRFDGVTDTKEMLERHLSLLATFRTSARGPLTLTREQFIARLHEDHRTSGQRRAKYGYYRLSDSIRETFKMENKDEEA